MSHRNGVWCAAALVIFACLYIISVLVWGWIFMLVHGAFVGAGSPGYWTQAWGFWHAVIPWGLIAPFVLG